MFTWKSKLLERAKTATFNLFNDICYFNKICRIRGLAEKICYNSGDIEFFLDD